jgi:hypothetical protein
MKTPLQCLGWIIWNISEYLYLPLGKLAPIVFGWMIGHGGKKLNTQNK